MENKKKQLLDAMKALPMTMEDKYAFVDLISQNSNGGGSSQGDEYLYLDLSDVNEDVDLVFWLSFTVHSMVCYSTKFDKNIECKLSDTLINHFDVIAIKISMPYYMVLDNYYKISDKNAVIQLVNSIGAKEITKDEYYNLIDVSFNDYVETPVDELPL